MNAPTTKGERIETWLPVVGCEGRYEVSDLGRVRSLDAVVMKRRGHLSNPDMMVPHRIKGRILKRGTGSHYPIVKLFGWRSAAIHRLVLEAFRGHCPEGQEACHGNGDTTNAALANLRWDTRLANNADRQRHGTVPRGEHHSSAVLSTQQVLMVLDLARVRSCRSIAREFGVAESTVRAIRDRKTWKHLHEIDRRAVPA